MRWSRIAATWTDVLGSPVSDYCSFFFFQAEDGIRDLTVTGVQTCALPISAFYHPETHSISNDLSPKKDERADSWYPFENSLIKYPMIGNLAGSKEITGNFRSEERRVGKECRSRWSPYH